MTAPDPAAPPAPVTPDPATPPTPDAPPLKPETDWKAEARKWEDRAKENKTAAEELATIKAAQMTAEQKAQADLDIANKRTAALLDRTVKAEVRALAAETFADPTDAHLYLDLSKYANAEGEVDAEAIKTDLAAVLDSKQHLAKPTGPNVPKPDPGQGVKPNGTPSIDQRIEEAMKAGNVQLSTALKLQKQAEGKG